MKIEKRDLKKHLFICCNIKENGAYCSAKGSEAIVKSLKMRLKQENLWDKIKVSKSGCLGPCSEGIAACLYPDNLLMTKLESADENALYEMLTK